jgi:hypothetical protein
VAFSICGAAPMTLVITHIFTYQYVFPHDCALEAARTQGAARNDN